MWSGVLALVVQQGEGTSVLFRPISVPESGAPGPTTSQDWHAMRLSQPWDGKNLGHCPSPEKQDTYFWSLVGNSNPLSHQVPVSQVMRCPTQPSQSPEPSRTLPSLALWGLFQSHLEVELLTSPPQVCLGSCLFCDATVLPHELSKAPL